MLAGIPVLIHHKAAPCTSILEVCSDVPVQEFERARFFSRRAKRPGLLYILIDGEGEIVNLASQNPWRDD